jgi:plastocyanin
VHTREWPDGGGDVCVETSNENTQERKYDMKRLRIIIAGLSVVTALAIGFVSSGFAATRASAHSPYVSVLIQHRAHGCHSWSLNGGPSRAALTVRVDGGTTITFTDNDVMSHKLIKTSGPALKVIGNRSMARMGASVKVLLWKPGTYRFATKAGPDYKAMASIKTIGEDNDLRLTVTVS